MARYLLDTDAIIDYLSGIPKSVEMIKELHLHGDDLCVCDVVAAELFAGIRPNDRADVFQFIASLRFLPTSLAAGRRAGEWRYQHARAGRVLSTTDMLVAATAHDHGAGLVTGNVAHYPMAEIRVVPLPRARRV